MFKNSQVIFKDLTQAYWNAKIKKGENESEEAFEE